MLVNLYKSEYYDVEINKDYMCMQNLQQINRNIKLWVSPTGTIFKPLPWVFPCFSTTIILPQMYPVAIQYFSKLGDISQLVWIKQHFVDYKSMYVRQMLSIAQSCFETCVFEYTFRDPSFV